MCQLISGRDSKHKKAVDESTAFLCLMKLTKTRPNFLLENLIYIMVIHVIIIQVWYSPYLFQILTYF